MPFKMAHGVEMWEMASKNPMFNRLFNDAMACTTKAIMQEVMTAYKDGLGCIGSLVDVGGGTGGVIAEIVKANPHIRGINFDLPHVVATAPPHPGVEHVSGSMFESIPDADAIFLKVTRPLLHLFSKLHHSISLSLLKKNSDGQPYPLCNAWIFVFNHEYIRQTEQPV